MHSRDAIKQSLQPIGRSKPSSKTMATVAASLFLCAGAHAAPMCGGHVNSNNTLLIGQTETRCPWPFKVEDIILACIPTRFGEATYVIAKAKAFPLNGSAKTAGSPSPYFELGAMKDIAANDTVTMPWIKPARELCSDGRASKF